MTLPVLGFGKDAGVRIDLPAFLERRLLVQAASGGGKSTVMRALAEQLSGKVQQFVIDTEGDLVTLREAGDFVIVGVGADVPLDLKTAKLFIRRMMELGASAIFDLSGIDVRARRQYVAAIFDELSHLPRTLWHPLVVWLDEGHVFAPQSESAVSTEAVATAASTWRKRGYCLVVATQRLSKLDKDVAAELHNKLIGFTDDIDVKRAGDQLGMTAEQRSQLQQLQPLTFFAKGPAFPNGLQRELVRSPIPKTSPPPKGEARITTPPAPEKVRAILGKLADLAKESEEELRTAEDLRRAVAERDREIRALKRGVPTKTVEKPVIDLAAIDSAYRRGEIAAEARIVKSQRDATKAMRGMIENLARVNPIIDMIGGSLKQTLASIESIRPAQGERLGKNTAEESRAEVQVGNSEKAKGTGANQPSAQTVARSSRAPARAAVASNVGSSPVSGPQQRMLNTLAWFEVAGVDAPNKSHVAVFSDQSPTSSGVDKNFSTLRTAGMIEYAPGGRVMLTEAGRAIANYPSAPGTLSDLHDAWLGRVSGPQSAMLALLIERQGESLTRQEVADATGQSSTSSGLDKNFSTLRSLGLIDYGPNKTAFATNLLFPEGLQ